MAKLADVLAGWVTVDKPAKGHSRNLETLIEAAKNGDLACLEVRIRATGETAAVIAAVGSEDDNYVFTPFALMFNGDPYEMLDPPNPDGGFWNPEEE